MAFEPANLKRGALCPHSRRPSLPAAMSAPGVAFGISDASASRVRGRCGASRRACDVERRTPASPSAQTMPNPLPSPCFPRLRRRGRPSARCDSLVPSAERIPSASRARARRLGWASERRGRSARQRSPRLCGRLCGWPGAGAATARSAVALGGGARRWRSALGAWRSSLVARRSRSSLFVAHARRSWCARASQARRVTRSPSMRS